MAKQAESEALKAVVEAFNKLSVDDQDLFKSKLWSKIFFGLTVDQKAVFKKKRDNFLKEVEAAKKQAEQLEAISNLSIEELENLLKQKKASNATQTKKN